MWQEHWHRADDPPIVPPMSLLLRWTGMNEADAVAEVRLRCYAHAAGELPELKKRIHTQGRAQDGDFLLAERHGQLIGTATSLRLTMWMRGAPISCQGVAWVGTIKTQRRRTGLGGGRGGVASMIMDEVLRLGRERGEVVSALMPFRASFYEHFGYGNVERRNEWTIPLSIMPSGDCAGIRFMEERDRPGMFKCWQRAVERGQCDIERTPSFWERYWDRTENGMVVVDEPAGTIRGWMFLMHQNANGRDVVRVMENVYDDAAALVRQLCFLGSLRDQYWGASLVTPVDLPLNLLLRETQLPHRAVTHATAEVRTQTRTQVRVLDHVALLGKLRVPEHYRGTTVVAVRETEGGVAKFSIELHGGRVEARKSDASADVEMTDCTWASVVCGELPAAAAGKLGLLTASKAQALDQLAAFADGPVPFCRDAF